MGRYWIVIRRKILRREKNHDYYKSISVGTLFCKAILDEDHSDTLSAMNNLANTYSELGRKEDEEKLRNIILKYRKT